MWKRFFSTIRSYSLSERLISILLAVFFVFSVSNALDFSFSSANAANVYHEGVVGQLSTLNPLFINPNDVTQEVARLIFSGLTKYDPEKKAIVGDMADVKLDTSEKVYTFTLKNGVVWHDGQPVTADDIVFTFSTVVQSPKFSNPLLKANFEGVDIDKVDDKTVKFTLNKPNSFFITNFTVGILPKHVFKDVPIDELQSSNLNDNPVGTGPYKVLSPYRIGLNEEGEIHLKRFDKYYGGQAILSDFVMHTYPTADIMKKDSGNLNGIVRITGDEIDLFRGDKRFDFIPYELPQYNAVFFNMDRPVFTSNVRLAMQKAIDKKEMMKLLPERVAIDTPLMQLDQDAWEYQPNLTQAQGALFDAGWKLYEEKGQKIRKNKKGEVLTLKLVTAEFSPNTRKARDIERTTAFLKKSWGDLGIQVDVVSYPLDQFAGVVEKRDYDLLLAGQNLGYNLDIYNFWHSTQATEEGLNLSNYQSFSADALIEDIRRTFDEDKKDVYLKRLAQVMSKDVPAIFLFRDVYYYASDRSVPELSLKDIAFPSDRFSNITEWKKS